MMLNVVISWLKWASLIVFAIAVYKDDAAAILTAMPGLTASGALARFKERREKWK